MPSPNLLRNILWCYWISYTRLSRSLATYSTVFYYQVTSNIGVLQPPPEGGFGLFPVRSSLTKGISYDFFSSGYLDISVPQLTSLLKRVGDLPLDRPGYPIRTPPDHSCFSAPRRLSRSTRPSSAKQAKASTICINSHFSFFFGLQLKLKMQSHVYIN